MNNTVESLCKHYESSLIEFTQELVRIKSFSDQERDVAHAIVNKMHQLGFDEAYTDKTGNVVGRIGNGPVIIQFDSHMDTVEVNDETEWTVPPFSGDIVEGRLYGRGSVDMKGPLSASIHAAIIARESGFCEGKTLYVTGTVCEEYCDGESLKMLYAETEIHPDFCIICEPSDNIIAHGHNGKAQILITTHGVSAHGSAPEKGLNAVYEMAEIIQRVEALNAKLAAQAGEQHGTVVLSDIQCISASLNAVPSECSIYLDRRMVPRETEDTVRKEMEAIIKDKKATWKLGTLRRTTWTGASLLYEPLHAPWAIAPDHQLAKACDSAYAATFGSPPTDYVFWDFSTNAVTPVSMGIPCIGFGPGESKRAHMLNENCGVDKIRDACRFYINVIAAL